MLESLTQQPNQGPAMYFVSRFQPVYEAGDLIEPELIEPLLSSDVNDATSASLPDDRRREDADAS